MTRYIYLNVCSNSEASEARFGLVTLTDADMEELKLLREAFKAG